MKYVCISTFNEFIKSIRVVAIYFCSVIFFCLFQLYIMKDTKIIDVSLKTLGIACYSDFLSLLVYFLNIYFYFFIMLKLFLNDFHDNLENILSRMSKRRYLIYKFLFILVILLVNKLIGYFIISSICGIPIDWLSLVIDINFNVCLFYYYSVFLPQLTYL